MSSIIEGDITDVSEGIIMHQVNCKNRIGAGVSGAIINKYPEVEKEYHNSFKKCLPEKLFGSIIEIHINQKLSVINCYSQFSYGNSAKTGITYTDMDMLVNHIRYVCANNPDKTIYVPYGIGCGLAGGNWDFVYSNIEHINNLVIVKFNK